MKFDNVLVAVDGSTLSNIAIDLALHSASIFSARLTFVNVVDNTDHGEIDEGRIMTRTLGLRVEGETALKKAAKEATEKGVEFKTELVYGIPWQVLSDMSKDYDMLILSVTGRSSFGLGKIGETARKVLENGRCPILTIKSGSHRVESVLLPANSENLPAIDLAVETVRRINGKLTILCVESKDFNAAELAGSIAKRCEEAGIKYETAIESGKPAEVICAESGKHDLVVMGTEGLKGIKKAFKGSTAEKVMLNSSCPVTIVRNDYS